MASEIIHAYLDRTLGGAELISVDDHIASCEECRRRATEFAGPQARIALPIDGTPLHLTFDQLDKYVRDQADDVEQEIAELHLANCSSCRAELEALRAVDAELRDPVTAGASASFIDRIAAFLSTRPLAFALPILLLAGAAIAVYWVMNRPATIQQGEVLVQQPETVEPVDNAPVNSPIEPTDLTAGAEVAATTLRDGTGELKLDADGNVIGTFSGEYDKRIAAALRTGTVPVADEAARLRSAVGVLMGPAKTGALRAQSPVGKVIESDRPEFRWSSVPGAASYRVEVFDSNYTKITESPAIDDVRWRPGTALPRGREYTWQVTAVKDGETVRAPERPAPDARFIVLSAAKMAEIERAKRSHPRSNLVLGLVYSDAGLLDEAEAQFNQLARKNPDSQLARKLLASIRAKK